MARPDESNPLRTGIFGIILVALGFRVRGHGAKVAAGRVRAR